MNSILEQLTSAIKDHPFSTQNIKTLGLAMTTTSLLRLVLFGKSGRWS